MLSPTSTDYCDLGPSSSSSSSDVEEIDQSQNSIQLVPMTILPTILLPTLHVPSQLIPVTMQLPPPNPAQQQFIIFK